MISISNSSTVDTTATRIICRFEDYSIPLSMNYVARLVLCAGANPSYAILGLPLRQAPASGSTQNWDQTSGVAMRGDGPAGYIKPFSKGTVGILTARNQFHPLFHGRVAYTSNMLGQHDTVMPCLFDRRWDLDKFTCGGRLMTDGSKTWWDHSDLIYNRFGFGDCMDVNGYPLHSQGVRFGHEGSEDYDPSDDPEPGYATDKSRMWRCTDIFKNLKFRFQSKGRPSFWQDIGLQDIPDDIIWPDDLGANIKENRTPRELNLTGQSLLTALQNVARYAGPYDINIVALPNGKSELRVIDMAPKKQAGTIFYDSSYFSPNLDSASKSENLIIGGFIKESVVNCFPGGVAVFGDKYATEMMASTDSSGTGALYLQAGWTTAEESSYKLKIASYEEDRFAFDYANKSHPSVYNFYKLNPAMNPFNNTKHSLAPQNGQLTIKAHQLTSYNVSNNPAGLTPREIVVEYKRTQREYDALSDDPEDSNSKARLGWWVYAGRFSELQLDPSRTMIRIDALREAKFTWALVYPDEEFPDSDYDTAYMVRRQIRIQLVAESNHRLVARLGGGDAGGSSSSGSNGDDPNGINKRLAPDAPKFVLNMYNDPLQYVDWTRSTRSRPVGEASVPSGILSKFPAKATQGNEIFTDLVGDGDLDNPKNRLLRHGVVNLKNYKRIEYSGQLELQGIFAGYLPGQQLAYENGAPIGDVSGIIKCVVHDCHLNRTTIEWGPAEFSAIYDQVQPIQGSGVVTLASPSESSNTSKKQDIPDQSSDTGKTTKQTETPYQTETVQTSYPQETQQSVSIPSDNDSSANSSANSGMQALSEMASKAEGDITGMQSLGKVLNAAGSGGTAGNAGSGGQKGEVSNDKSVVRPGESMEAYGERMKSQNMMDNIKSGFPESKGEASEKKKSSTIRTGDEIKNKDYNLGENSGFDSETRKAGKGIYFGDSLKGLDEDRKQDSFAPGGLRDQFREGTGQQAVSGRPAEQSYMDKTYGKADANGLRYANVDRGGFNPNNAAPKSNNNRGEPVKPTMSLEDAKRAFGRSVGISDAQFNKNRELAAKGRARK